MSSAAALASAPPASRSCASPLMRDMGVRRSCRTFSTRERISPFSTFMRDDRRLRMKIPATSARPSAAAVQNAITA